MKDLILFNMVQSYNIFRTFSAVLRQRSDKHLKLLLMNQLLTHREIALNMVYNLFNEFDCLSLVPTGYFSIFQKPLCFPNLAQLAIYGDIKPRTEIVGCWRLGLSTIGEAVNSVTAICPHPNNLRNKNTDLLKRSRPLQAAYRDARTNSDLSICTQIILSVEPYYS